MRKSLPYGIATLPGTRVTERPDLVHVQFERRRARQFMKLIERDGGSRMAVAASQRPAWKGLMLTGSHR